MRLQHYLKEAAYNNWVRYTPESVKWDFEEYKKKETYKWKDRMDQIMGRWPIFDSQSHLKKELDKAKVVNLKTIKGVTSWTNISDDDGIKNMIGTYKRPRDVDRIVQGFESGVKMPMPILLKSGNKYWPLAGNTRQNTAGTMGILVKVLVINVEKGK